MFRPILQLFKLVFPVNKLKFAALILLSFLAGIFEVLSIGAIIPLISVVSDIEEFMKSNAFLFINKIINFQSEYQVVTFVVIIFIVITVVSGLIRIFNTWFQIKFANSIGTFLSVKAYGAIISQPYTYFLEANSSEVASTIFLKLMKVIQRIIYPIFLSFTGITSALFIVAALLITSWQITIIAIGIFIALYYFIFISSNRSLKARGKIVTKSQDVLFRVLQDTFGSIRDILIDRTADLYKQSYLLQDKKMRNQQARIDFLALSPKYVLETVILSLVALGILIFYEDANNLIALMGLFAYSAIRLLPIFQMMYSNIAGIVAHHKMAQDLLDIIDNHSTTENQQSNIKGFIKTEEEISFKEQIVFSDVAFSYDSRDSEDIISNINLEINKGDIVGILGKTGSGKSTFLDLFLGLLKASSGKISIDGIELNIANQNSWLSHISHVPQSIFLIDGTIEENIIFNPFEAVNKDKLYQATKDAYIYEDILNWPEQFNTRVGERGVQLSGGQRQRIGLARAFYRNKEILIFDEATSALDNDTEKLVIETLIKESSNLTIIMVAHRLSTLKYCNKIFKLEDGKIFQGSLGDFS